MIIKRLLILTGLVMAALMLDGCGGGAVEPEAVAPTAIEPTAVPPTDIPATETPVPPTATPDPPTETPLPPTETPIPPTETPAPTPTTAAILGPSPREYSTMVYDSESERIILVGGQLVVRSTGDRFGAPSDFNDKTWAYDAAGNQWTRMNSFPGGARGAMGMAYDAESDRVILFGGHDHTSWQLNDTWAYDYNTDIWEQVAAGPPNHLGPRLAYDAESDRVILFGGWNGQTGFAQDDTWAYDYNSDTWTKMDPSVRPPGRNSQLLIYDAESDRIITWGGFGVDYKPVDDRVWAYDFNTDAWAELKPGEGPAPLVRFDTIAAYDVESDRIVTYGGEAYFGDAPRLETWTYDYNTNTWNLMQPTANPGPLLDNAMAYSDAADRVILFGGYSEGQLSAATWSYDFNSDTWTDMTTRE